MTYPLAITLLSMSVSSQLWQANQDLILACLKHPFVQSIADGTLERKKFGYYVGQDAFFSKLLLVPIV